MISRRTFLGGAAAAGIAAGAGILSGCGSQQRGGDYVSLWGVGGDSRPAQQKVIDGFRKDHPEVTIDAKNVPSNGNDGDATNVITAVRGGTAPDLWWMDRFAAAQYASLGLLEPIDSLIKKYEDENFLDSWLTFAVNELSYNGQTFGLPTSTDTRGLYYNKKMLRDAGIDPDELAMSNGPIALDRLFEICDKITTKDKRGNYTKMGFIPWHGQGWGYTWGVGLGASYFDNESCEMTMLTDESLRAHQMIYDFAREFDYSRISAFVSSYEPSNAPPGQTAFYTDRLAFDIGTSGTMNGIRQYAPKLDWGYTHLPIFDKGMRPYTWSGGFGLVMPKGSSMTKNVWDFMKYYAGVPGLSIYSPATLALPTRPEVFSNPGLKELQPAIAQLKFSTSRPPVPVGQLWWDSLVQAQESVTIGSKTAKEALQTAQARVGGQMQANCPFKLPPDYGQPGT
ncbi:ABC transporter substrate-binding protein [Microlunatus elymi]|uniref:ABC transporter substrate-binding protein n=1 Tax=Microlunatus elymi TaxID=2596828 RepID=A0A516Q784_9ACTN|nr:ABC transporter substrate-binding protein [Microlunatus elymi]QDP99031.1 ABC transporter substrate-binding protein [Microlunatus elymi]